MESLVVHIEKFESFMLKLHCSQCNSKFGTEFPTKIRTFLRKFLRILKLKSLLAGWLYLSKVGNSNGNNDTFKIIQFHTFSLYNFQLHIWLCHIKIDNFLNFPTTISKYKNRYAYDFDVRKSIMKLESCSCTKLSSLHANFST